MVTSVPARKMADVTRKICDYIGDCINENAGNGKLGDYIDDCDYYRCDYNGGYTVYPTIGLHMEKIESVFL